MTSSGVDQLVNIRIIFRACFIKVNDLYAGDDLTSLFLYLDNISHLSQVLHKLDKAFH